MLILYLLNFSGIRTTYKAAHDFIMCYGLPWLSLYDVESCASFGIFTTWML